MAHLTLRLHPSIPQLTEGQACPDAYDYEDMEARKDDEVVGEDSMKTARRRSRTSTGFTEARSSDSFARLPSPRNLNGRHPTP